VDGKVLAVGAMVVAGGLVALQAPINGMLGKTVGSLAAASISFAIGLVCLVSLTVLVGGGFGEVGEARTLPWYYLIGGALGAVYVTAALISVRTLGAGGVTGATIAGQLMLSVTIDRLGILGLEQKPLSMARIVGVALLALGVVLIVRD